LNFLPIPTPVPTAGTPCDLKPSFVHRCFVVVLPLGSIPDFGRFYGSHGAVFHAVPCSPKTSLIAHANRFVLKRVYGLGRVLTTGSDELQDRPSGVTEWHSGNVQRLGSCRFLRASRLAPLIPLRREPLRPRNIPRLWTRERAGEENRAFLQIRNPPSPR